MKTEAGEAGMELYALPARRRVVNTATRIVVALGGGAVIAAIALIFLYLLWVVLPIFAGASIEDGRTYSPRIGPPLYLDVNESDEIGLAFGRAGEVVFWDLASGEPKRRADMGREIAQVVPVYGQNATYALRTPTGEFTLVEARYPVSFEQDERRIDAVLTPVFDEQFYELGEATDFDVHLDADTLTVASIERRTLTLARYRNVEREFELELPRLRSVDLEARYDRVIFGPRGRLLYLTNGAGSVEILEITRSGALSPLHHRQLIAPDAKLTALAPLLGRYSLLVADDQRQITQWFLVRGEFGSSLEPVRRFELDDPALELIAEPRRKGFAAIDAAGRAHLLYTTSQRHLASHRIQPHAGAAVISPRSDVMLLAGPGDEVNSYELHNEHPDISLSTLWNRVWYEGYPEPVYSWQSSAADTDFEAKFSLTPLLFGTIKAAFYAMLFAVPLAIMGALYTAYFMAPVMRRIVKPGIEIMAALPTVILGFLAGLWLAPLIEEHLAAFLVMPLLLPIAILATSLLWQVLPERVTGPLDGWFGLLIIPAIVAAVWFSFVLGPVLEVAVLGGDARSWFLTELGLEYDQRNALVVGLAMGLAVVPTIFSIAEDAIYGVPTHLINGSLALGATQWQTLIRVVILTASPGIFSAVMIGLGRAVGETMIVLMATGNTPLMDMNIFEGMRTFAANIAVELPESEVGSSHYRILFLTALVLFLITFIFNTVAEIVRQRLRTRYGNL